MATSTLGNLLIKLGLDASGVKPGVATAKRELTGLSRGINNVSNAGSHFKKQVSSFGKAAGLIGGVGLAYASVNFLKDSIGQAQQWGKTVDELDSITGLGTKRLSQFSDAFDKFGIDAGQQTRLLAFMAKTLGNLSMTVGATKKIQDEYGFSLRDQNGKMKDSLAVIEDFTAYFNDKSIPAYKKASLGAKLFGRGWTTLLPIFQMGEQGFKDAMAASMVMTDKQRADLHTLRDSQREYNDSVGDLKVKIGMMIVPELAKLTKAASDFISSHETDITQWFAKGLTAAKQFGTWLANDIIPTIVNLAQTAIKFWNGLPGPLKDILIKGFVAEKAVKFLFGFSIADIGKDIIGGAIKGIAGSFFSRGSTPVNPLFVKDITGGLGGGTGGPGGAAGGGRGLAGKVGTGLAVGAAVVGVAGFVAVSGEYLHDVSQHTAETNEKFGDFLQTNPTAAQMDSQIAALREMPNKLSGLDRLLFDANASGVKDTWQQNMDKLAAVHDAIIALPAKSGAQLASAVASLESKGMPVTADAVVAQVAQDDANMQSQASLIASEQADRDKNLKSQIGVSEKRTRGTLHETSRAQARAARHAAHMVEWATKHGFSRIAPGIASTATNTARTASSLTGLPTWVTDTNYRLAHLFDGGPDLPGRARGGSAGANSWSIVGEDGPELLHMGARGGWVHANPVSVPRMSSRRHDVSGGTGGGGDVYHFHVGTLIANDSGIDELERRMDDRKRRRTRGAQRLAGTG